MKYIKGEVDLSEWDLGMDDMGALEKPLKKFVLEKAGVALECMLRDHLTHADFAITWPTKATCDDPMTMHIELGLNTDDGFDWPTLEFSVRETIDSFIDSTNVNGRIVGEEDRTPARALRDGFLALAKQLDEALQ